MKYLLPILLIFTSCDNFKSSIEVKNGHIYRWVDTVYGHFEHDPNCPECKKIKKDDLNENT